MKEINWFDTPDDRRRGRHGMANLMGKILNDREKEREAVKNMIPNKYINLSELKEKHEKYS